MKQGGFPERNWRRGWLRALVLIAALPLLATITWPPPPLPPPGPGDGVMLVTRVALDANDPGRRRVGALRFLDGWALASADDRFGGISALHVEGGAVTAISDTGMVIRFPVPGARARLPVRFDPLVEGRGTRTRKENRDSEAMLIRDGQMWIAFERHNMIWRYDRATLRAQAAARPPPMRRWGSNSGAEALVRLADGRVLVLAEGRSAGATSDAVLFAGDPAVAGTRSARLRYHRPAGFRATDAALLPDGRILILNRRFGWLDGLSARLVAARIGLGGVIAGTEIAALAAPLTIDNLEALSVVRDGDPPIMSIASDDNFSPLQRPLLLKFELVEYRGGGGCTTSS